MNNIRKPLGSPAYGSIGHLPTSRLGPGDHRIPDGQASIATTKIRDRHDQVFIEEKLDGSCCAVAKYQGRILALIRAGYEATTSRFEMHHIFAHWVRERESQFQEWLQEGERFCGEWLAVAHGTRYQINDPWDAFVVFDLIRQVGVEHRRVSVEERNHRLDNSQLRRPFLVKGPLSIGEALTVVGPYGRHNAIDPIEGAVWRVERFKRFEFAAKYVRPDHTPGRYLSVMTYREELWNWRP